MKSNANCIGTDCEYHKLVMEVIKTGTSSFMPDFSLPPTATCMHKSIVTKDDLGFAVGRKINTLSKCPKE